VSLTYCIDPFTLALKLVSDRFSLNRVWPNHIHLGGLQKAVSKAH